jgi:ABC-type uncharacterized transport system involved in gliding motility auxiliary subunit
MSSNFSSVKKYVGRKQFKYGGYALLITIVGIAIIVLINYGLTLLENNFDLKIDMSPNKEYSLNDQTKKIIGSLSKDIVIYTTYAPGSEDKEAQEIVNKIRALSTHITVQNVDTAANPAFLKPFEQNGSTVSDGSIIVTDKEGKLYRVLDQYAQYSYNYNQNTGSYDKAQIKVEGAVTSAVNYIQLGYIPSVYLVQGHGELAVGDLGDLAAYFSDENFNLQTVNIAQAPDKIKAGDIVMFVDPKTDITDTERKVLEPLMKQGGRFIFMFSPQDTDPLKLSNIMGLLKLYDISLQSGVVVEGSDTHMESAQYPANIMPDLQSHAITDPIISSNIPVDMPVSGVIQLPATAPDSTMKITSLLKSSDKSFLKSIEEASKNLTQSANDPTGPFDLAAAVEKDNNTGDVADDVRFVIFYNTAFATTSNVASYGLANIDLFMNSAGWLKNTSQDIYIRPVTVSTPQVRITTAATFWMLTIVSVLLIPIIMLVAGIVVYLRRKHL